MKTNLDQHAGRRPTDQQPNYGIHRTPTVDPPERHLSWFDSYDEEWEAFVEQQSIRKNKPGINHDEPEPLPRVWNCPHR